MWWWQKHVITTILGRGLPVSVVSVLSTTGGEGDGAAVLGTGEDGDGSDGVSVAREGGGGVGV